MSTNPEFSIQAFQDGDSKTFADVHKMYARRLVVWAGFLIRNKEEAEDIVQSTFAKLWVRRADFNASQDIQAFLHVTIRNACLDYLRHQKVARDNEAAIIQFLSDNGYWSPEASPGEKQRDDIERMALELHAAEASPAIKYYLDNDISSEKAAGFFNLSARTLRRLAQKHISRLRQKLGLR